jgi:hypothetical protein
MSAGALNFRLAVVIYLVGIVVSLAMWAGIIIGVVALLRALHVIPA